MTQTSHPTRDKALGKAPATSPNPPVLEYGATSDEARITRIVCLWILAFLCVSSYRGNGRAAILRARSKPCQATRFINLPFRIETKSGSDFNLVRRSGGTCR